jgi:hypothetical protein
LKEYQERFEKITGKQGQENLELGIKATEIDFGG